MIAGGGGPGRRVVLPVASYVDGILAGDRAVLARAITLIESTQPAHESLGQEVLQAVLSRTGQSLRIGVSGAPGVGKSTFIEAFGRLVIEAGHRLAVLAIDPTSPRTGGSVLGDKTRMATLARDDRAFIRPSPTVGTLGGVARRTREAMLLCEAAGFDVIIVETVGVGQSETAAAGMVDFFLVLLLASSGDDLQGIKRGILELADLIAINKADAEPAATVSRALADYRHALRILNGASADVRHRVVACSGLTGSGLDAIWSAARQARDGNDAGEAFRERRARQRTEWLWQTVDSTLLASLHDSPAVAAIRGAIEHDVRAGVLAPSIGARRLLDAYRQAPQP